MKRTVIPAVILLLALAAGIFFLSGGSLGTSVVGIKTFLGIQSPGGTASDAAGSPGRLFDNGDRSAGDVRILFATPDGIQVTSPNPVTAAAGSQVSFEISV